MTIWLDVKSGVRQLRRTPGMAVAAVATLAIGVGATTAIFSFIAAVMSTAAPAPDMARLVALWSHNRNESETKNAVSPADFLDWRQRATLVGDLAAIRRSGVSVGGLDSAVRTSLFEVTPNYFRFFRWSLPRGRDFMDADAAPGAPPVVILSDEFWRDSLASRPDVIGTTLRLDGELAEIVGVLPKMPTVSGVYRLVLLDATDRASRNVFVWGRLRPGASIEQARAEMQAIGESLEREHPRTNAGWSVNTRPLEEEFVGPQARLAVGLLGATVLSVLLIGCVNIANLLLARGFARRGEMAVRLALGASGWRVARQLFAECGVIAFAGALASVLVSRWTINLLRTTFPLDSPWLEANGLNARAMTFTLVASVLATFVSGLAPALAARRPDLVTDLHGGGRSLAHSNRRLTGALVATETSLAVVLLIVSGLLMRTLIAIERLEPGFDTTGVLTVSVTLPQRTTGDATARWFDQALERARAIPGVLIAGATSRVPFAGSRFNPNRGLEIEGRGSLAGDAATWAVDYIVTPHFFESLRIRLIDGRTFTQSDSAKTPLVAVVNETMAKRFWPARSPIGARLRQGDEPAGLWRTVVGIVADVRNDDADAPPLPYLYVPLAQRPSRTMTMTLRTAGDPATFAPLVRRAIADFDPDQALYDIRTMEEVVEADIAGSRILINVFGAFALIALGLAGVGVWGVAAQSVNQRTREIGLRMALGARAANVLTLTARQGLTPMAVGLLIGTVAGLAVARVMRSILFQVSPADPATLAMTVAALALVGVAAMLGPALGAARLDPLTALRES